MRAAVLALLAAAACRTGSAGEPPAYVVRPTPESRLALSQAVSRALGGAPVTLDDDALTTNGVLTIDRSQRPDPSRLVQEGRDPAEPGGRVERFHLVKIGEHCILVHDRTNQHYDLIGTDCAPR